MPYLKEAQKQSNTQLDIYYLALSLYAPSFEGLVQMQMSPERGLQTFLQLVRKTSHWHNLWQCSPTVTAHLFVPAYVPFVLPGLIAPETTVVESAGRTSGR